MEWELSEPSKKCILCGVEFQPGNHYNTAIFNSEEQIKNIIEIPKKQDEKSEDNPFKHTAQRFEFCPECFSSKIKETQKESVWTGDIVNKKIDKTNKPKLNKHEILILFKEIYNQINLTISEDEKVEKNAIAYFLAIMLERKNLLVHKSNSIDEMSGAKCAIYSEHKTEFSYTIKYPLLSSESMDQYRNQIYSLIGMPGKS